MIDPSWINAGAKVLGEAVKDAPPGPAISSATSNGSATLNSDGWIVNFGSGSAAGAPINKTDNRTDSRADSSGAGLLAGVPGMSYSQAGGSPWLMLGLALIFGGLVLKKVAN